MRLLCRSAFSFRSGLWPSTCVRKARSASKSGAAAYPLSLATIVVLAAVALTVRAGIDLNFENCAPLIAGAVLFGGVIFAVLWRVDAQLRCDFNPCVTIAIFALAYSHGALAFADVKLDASSGHDTQTAIHHKRIHVSGGPKGSSVWYQVQIDPEASPAGANGSTSNPISDTPSKSLGTPSAAARNGASSINRGPLMSAWGQKRTFRDFRMTSTLPPKADINWRSLEFPLCASRASSPPARLRL
jgi:hypothetical protein